MPKKSLPKKGTAEYNEQIADDPSDFIDESEEEEAGQDITPKPATKTTTKAKKSAQKAADKADVAAEQKEIDDLMSGMNPEQKGRMLAAMGVVAAASAPTGARTKYDHEATMNNLIDDTEEVVALMEKLKDDYEAVVYMWSLCNYWKSEHKIDADENRAKKKAHNAFLKHFKKHQHLHGLPPATPSTAGSKTSSRAASVALEEMEEVEEEEEEEEEVEETK
jgi:hypothetical protein